MSSSQRRCALLDLLSTCHILRCARFIDSETWRKEFKLDELVRTFDYTEKKEVFEFYPQYYHKTDKVIAFS